MHTKIGYRYDPELKVNRITHYLHLRSDYYPPCNNNEIIVPYDKLPACFDSKYQECEVIDGRVMWSPTLYHFFHHKNHGA